MKKKISLLILAVAIVGIIILGLSIQKKKLIKNPGKGYVKKELFDDNIFCGSSIYSKCEMNEECVIGGCVNQLCGSKGDVNSMLSSCEKRPCYEYERFNLKCGCKDNICQWY